MSETAEILKKAKALLVEKGWTKECYARGADGEYRLPTSPEATCFCVFGAVQAADGADESCDLSPEGWQARRVLTLAAVTRGYLHVPWFNDAQESVEPILALFDDAIAMAEAEAACADR